jgi:hypothetical protein
LREAVKFLNFPDIRLFVHADRQNLPHSPALAEWQAQKMIAGLAWCSSIQSKSAQRGIGLSPRKRTQYP